MKSIIFILVVLGAVGFQMNLTPEECCFKLGVVYSAEELSPKPSNGKVKTSPIDEGGNIYFQRCFYCHGPLLDGKGHMARGLKTSPVSFKKLGTIDKASESDLLSKINKKGHKYFIEKPPMTEKMLKSVLLFLNSRVGKN